MTGSVALDVVIGLVFIYLLYSLLATIVQEAVANAFSFRAKFLQKALVRMLEDGKAEKVSTFRASFAGIFKMFSRQELDSGLTFVKAFYNHPLIKYLGEDDYHSKPAYITAQNFSKTIIDLLRGQNFEAGQDPKPVIAAALAEKKIKWKNLATDAEVLINDETLSYLKSMWADSQGDVTKFKTLIEDWFDATMERASGWYKKHTQAVLLIIGLLIAIIFNVDTIKIAGQLSSDPVLRAQVVAQADTYVKTHQAELNQLAAHNATASSASADTSLKAIKAKADELTRRATELVNGDIAKVNKTLAIGWTCTCVAKADTNKHRAHKDCAAKTITHAAAAPKTDPAQPFVVLAGTAKPDTTNKDTSKTKASVAGNAKADKPKTAETKAGEPREKICIGANFSGSSILGWLLTAFALSLGAPFWFDMLSKLMKIRGSISSNDTKKEAGDAKATQPKNING